uniref:BZIP domain-containing protein n=1 Tax=Manihot esculenta TaxID=3983 RepID=A0A2C9TZE2_MANES
MEDPEFQEDDILLKLDFDDLGRLDWDNLFTGLPEASPPSLQASSSPANFCNSSPDSVSSWIGQLENILMKDDDNSVAVEPTQQLSNDFLADILVDSPPAVSAEVVDAATNRDSSASDNGIGSASEREKDRKKVVDDGAEVRSDGQDPQDPSSKKRRRQLRNRDAALRSRERKKMYVRDLEIKSRYLEGECRRLGRLLQCVIAENQALHISLQKGNAFGVTSAKQESAVLLLGMCHKLNILPHVAYMIILVPKSGDRRREMLF